LAARQNLNLFCLDVTTVFLHTPVDFPIFIEQPLGFVDQERPDYVCKLKTSIYGLKQSGRLWREFFATQLKSIGLKQTSDPSIYFGTLLGEDVLLS
jgi:hypothetical protein